jgi:hypothetical protein
VNLKLKRQWEVLKRGKPGRRFVERYQAAQRKENRATLATRIVRFGIAAVAIGLGVVFAVIPGPAIVFFALAGALLASESRGVARFFDWCEVKIRAVVRWAMRIWKRLPIAGKVAVAIVGAAGSVGATVMSYRIFAG